MDKQELIAAILLITESTSELDDESTREDAACVDVALTEIQHLCEAETHT